MKLGPGELSVGGMRLVDLRVGVLDALIATRSFQPGRDMSAGLTRHGETLVEELLEIGIVVDLTHCTPAAREDVYRINAARATPRPLVFSHSGVRALCNELNNPTDEEIRRIADWGGVIGIIFGNAWLTDVQRRVDQPDGLGLLVETADHIRNVGGVDAVGLGSDFDGLTDPFDDLKDSSEFPRVTQRLLGRFSEAEVRQILGGNARRVLNDGWSR